jgi:flagellar biosynthesis anti-sigma factor FlgM
MRIGPLTQAIGAEIKKVENAKKADSSGKAKAVPADSSVISSKAQRLSETQANAEAIFSQIANSPDVRAERVEEVRNKIKNGYYDTPEFLDKLTDKLMKDLGVTNA